jgi:hypothetical protein
MVISHRRRQPQRCGLGFPRERLGRGVRAIVAAMIISIGIVVG